MHCCSSAERLKPLALLVVPVLWVASVVPVDRGRVVPVDRLEVVAGELDDEVDSDVAEPVAVLTGSLVCEHAPRATTVTTATTTDASFLHMALSPRDSSPSRRLVSPPRHSTVVPEARHRPRPVQARIRSDSSPG
jgi:hypothetical protein